MLGISVDHVPCLKAWAKELGGISYPLLSDFWPHGAIAQCYGVLREEGYSERAIFLIDAEGIIRYVDVHDIDEQPDNEVILAELRRIGPGAARAEAEAGDQKENEATAESGASGATSTAAGVGESRLVEPAVAAEATGPRVTVYCTSWCPDCRRARAWLSDHGIDFDEVDVEKVPEAAEKIKTWNNGKLVTPTCDIDGTIVVDFDEARYEALLG